MATRASVISAANTAVEALPASMRTSSRSGFGQSRPRDVISLRERIAVPAAKAIPAPASINPSCR